MNIPRSHFKIQKIILLVTTGVGSIGKDLLMLTLYGTSHCQSQWC